MKRILIIHGPNLNMLGIREPGIYGAETFETLNEKILNCAKELNVEAEIFQSNCEGEIVTKIQQAMNFADGIIINPAAYTHYSIAIRDAIAAINIPVIEVHISNIHKREEFRHKSVTAPVTAGQIVGLGTNGYLYAMRAMVDML